MEKILEILLLLLGIYLAVGFLFALVFVFAGARKIDPVAREGTWGFKLLILPGSAAFWPLLLSRWVRKVESPPMECNAHRAAAKKQSS